MNEDLIESFSGVRGIWGKGLSKKLALHYGLAFARFLRKNLKRKPALIIGYDTRGSSKEIAKLFQKAFSFEAGKIIDAGIVPLPAAELAVRSYGLDGGVMITASHCPKEFNGWKLLDKTGAIISPHFLEQVKRLKERIEIPAETRRAKIISKHRDLKRRYIAFVKEIVGQKGLRAIRKQRFKIAVDPNGGAASALIKPLLKELGVRGIYLNMELGQFKRKIEPDFESLNYLRPIIKKEKASFGIGFDCDADRAELVIGEDCHYVKKHGPIVNGQYLLAILVDEVLSELKKPQASVVVTNDCTSALVRKMAQKYRAGIKEVEVGEINVVQKMLQEKSPIAGEGSNGGVIFRLSRCRDGILSLVILLRYLAKKKKKLSSVFEELPDFYSAATKLKCPAEKQIEIRAKIKAGLLKRGIKVQERGGKTGTVKALIEPDSFIFFRASKTEPGIFRIIADAPDSEATKELLKQGIEIFNQAKIGKHFHTSEYGSEDEDNEGLKS